MELGVATVLLAAAQKENKKSQEWGDGSMGWNTFFACGSPEFHPLYHLIPYITLGKALEHCSPPKIQKPAFTSVVGYP